MENYLPIHKFSSLTSSPPPSSSSSLSLNNNIFATENINHLCYNNNNGFLGLMSEMNRVENHHQVQGSVVNGGSGTTSASQISLENSTSDNNNNNKLGIMSKKLISTSKGQKKVRKPKYAFQTRSQVDILDDGYRWRKYGQKAVKNNKFPRSYYRCTYQGCNVKKQVQRLTKDEGIVVTTYEGMHSHSIDKSTDNFEHILTQMQIYSSF